MPGGSSSALLPQLGTKHRNTQSHHPGPPASLASAGGEAEQARPPGPQKGRLSRCASTCVPCLRVLAPACAHACADVRAPLGTAPVSTAAWPWLRGSPFGVSNCSWRQEPRPAWGRSVRPDPTWHPAPPGGWTSELGSVCPVPLCGFAPRPGFNDPRAHFRSGALGAGGGGTCPTTESARKTPDGTKEKKPPKQALGGGGPATARPGKPHRAAPAPAPPPELGVPPARGAEGAVGPGSRPFSPTRGREPQPLVGPGLGSGRLPLPTLARLLFVGSTCVGPDKPRRTLAETVWPPKGGMEGSRRSVDSFGLP